ncbi:hypothetical protein PYW08_012757 [Mythimna loreyi]|uniref:Uncharacterized protein n=1 Tax=Mythimna loreyi TaxID=667449 RepID=A0ACC2Q2Y3_9NEOP|nr:hypothetical protein PYW08_012757 [Mythimna loreyi]
MFQIISLGELFDSEQRVEAMKIARSCLKLMDGDTKRDVLNGVQQNCRSSAVLVRKEAFSVFLTAFQGLFKRESFNPFKRKALDSSPILDTIDKQNDYEKLVVKKIFEGMFDFDEGISKLMCEGVEECLSKDFNLRFAELFYIIVYQCSLTTNNNYELSNCGSKLLQLLFSDLRSQDAFKVIQLRDEGLPQSILRDYESISVRTKTMARTILRSGVTYRQRPSKAPPRRDIDVQKSITDILDVFLRLSKTNSQICQELCVQMMKCLQGTGRRFDLDSVIAKQLFDIIRREPFCLTPLVLDACRVFVKDISSIPGFNESVKELKQAVSNSEGYLYTNILFEDLQLRSGDRNQFIFSMFKEDSDAAMRNDEFTIQGLIDVFGSLSNWDDLRIQDKKQIEDSLPPLWTKNEDFTVSLREYFEGANKKLDYGKWFNKMVASYYPEEVTQNRISWLKQTEKWPKKDFVTSAIIEAIQWHQNDAKLFGNINSTDCLAEWAARLMIRSSYYNQQQNSMESDSQERSSFAKDELIWCQAANEKKLPSVALQCIDRNKGCLLDVEILPWVQERVEAYRTIGLKENNWTALQKALDAAEKQTARFASQSSFETNVSMQKLILQLHHDLGTISKTKLDDVMQIVTMHICRQKGQMMSSKNAQVLKCLYETAMLHYDGLWNDNDESTQNDVIQGMLEIIDKMLDHNLATDCNVLISVLLNRLAHHEHTISDDTARSILQQINRVLPRLDFFSIAILKGLPAHVLNKEYLDKLQETDLDVCKEYFQLICDANYSLLQYCDDLRKNVLDDTEWNIIFNRMKNRLFETKYGGTDYQSLNTMKNKLYALEDTDEIDPKAKELKQIIEDLRSKPQRKTLRLSQLCPDLTSDAILERKRVLLQRLLRLPPNVYVVKFAEQISVFTDSIRRPCVVKALLSTGETRRFMIKSGEPMYHDASVQRAAAVLMPGTSYNVTPLSDDSAIIEYLEDHIRLRDLMEEKHDINVAAPKAGYEKLILAPSLAMEQYNVMCEKVTPYILRSAIENNSSCVKEFITKKRTFEDTLSSMTILNWMFGVGDRHLQNIMYCVRDGSVCGVDWASVFQYGCQELPPARLTANILAVCDVKVLESRLQKMLLHLRESQKLFVAFIKTSFYQSGPEFNELKHVKNILLGKTVSYEITRERIQESEKRYKVEYVKLLDQVFDNFVPKDEYSVEEQVSCLLQHSTDPRILAVTQPGWEAWL